ncbi:MAG: hypothetical protein GXO83_06890 [Chlorobi bacterium]|nr:hypothetical protein [Chlorobiota bacterium]
MKLFVRLLFFIGVLLLAINAVGLFKSLRNPDLASEKTPYKNDLTISYAEAKKNWDRKPDESEKDYALRTTMLVNHAMAHYWKDEGIRKYNIRVPIWENYILYFASMVKPEKYRKYEFRDFKKAIERGVGICSQPSIALKGLLNANGIKADLWDIAGHVVVCTTFDDGTGWILDPDYGKYVPHNIKAIEANPELVRESYKDQNNIYASHVTKHRGTDDIVNIYEKEGNHIYYMNSSFENFSYISIWIIPFLFMLPYLLILYKRK